MRDHLSGPVGPLASSQGTHQRRAEPLSNIRLFNTLTRQKEDFVPLEPGHVRIYTCGPTVYRYAHIGNLRAYLVADWLRRLLGARGYTVTHAKNITDVGHMRQEMLERGEDKVIAAALAAGKTPQEIAAFFTSAFLADEGKLNILPAHLLPRASDNVPAMIDLIATLLEKGFAYVAGGNVYFQVAKFADYGKLSGRRGSIPEEDVHGPGDPWKRDPRDFTLWKAAEPGRTLKWPSPWGEGFPGWHIECSAMVRRHLGDVIDIHTGGVDNIFPHHEDEIAQSEAALGRQHVITWLHIQHLLVDGVKMAKSAGNTYHLADLERRGFDPLAFRYLCATVHYRTRLNFTMASLRAAQKALLRLRTHFASAVDRETMPASSEARRLRASFWGAAADDLNIPAALAVAWRVARSGLPGSLKRALLLEFDQLLGLGLDRPAPVVHAPDVIANLLRLRDDLRRRRSYRAADAVRERIEAGGFRVQDMGHGSIAVPARAWDVRREVSASSEVDSLLDSPPEFDLTVSVVARQGCAELERCLRSVDRWLGRRPAEIIVVDNGFEVECGGFVNVLVDRDQRFRLVRTDHFLGSAAGRNISLRQARGSCILLLDTSVEIIGDIFSALMPLLADPTVGIAGRWGVVTDDLRSFREATSSGDVHAVEGYLMALRRDVVREVGFLDEKYRFYRHMDLDYSFAVRSRGYRAVIDVNLPAIRHEHVEWESTPPDDRERLSKRNFYRFLHRWGARRDLLAIPR